MTPQVQPRETGGALSVDDARIRAFLAAIAARQGLSEEARGVLTVLMNHEGNLGQATNEELSRLLTERFQ